MKTIVILLCLQCTALQCIANNEWHIEREENGATGSCKIHKSGYKYCKIEKEMAFSLKELAAINTDADYLASWMETAMYSEQIEKVSDTNYVNYLQYDIPYPFKDRDSATRTIITQDDETKIVKMEFKTDNSLKEQSIEFEPMEFIFGYWKFIPLSKGISKVEYAVLVLPGGNLHPILYNPRAIDVAWDTVQNMEKTLISKKYMNTEVNFINDF